MVALALLITIATSSALLPSTTRAPRSALRSAPPGGADLYNGEDDERNAQVAALKRSFYGVPAAPRAEASRSRVAVRSRSSFGLLEDVPLCRWSGALLPHSQLALNVWQPQYTHLFEELFATPEPWYYAHVRLPGGAANLNNPAYDFCAPDCSAPRAGTLMRVASFRREADNRLSVVVQGVARCIVERGPAPASERNRDDRPPFLARSVARRAPGTATTVKTLRCSRSHVATTARPSSRSPCLARSVARPSSRSPCLPLAPSLF